MLRTLGTASRVSSLGASRTLATRFGSNISIGSDGKLHVPSDPIVPFIEVRATGSAGDGARASLVARRVAATGGERGAGAPNPQPLFPDGLCLSSQGDGTGPDIWRSTKNVLDSAVQKVCSAEA